MKIFEKCPTLKCPHAFSTRLGGVSEGDFRSLNLGLTYGDDLTAVEENWKIFSSATNIPIKNLVITDQIHKNNVAIVDSGDSCTPKNPKPMTGHDGLVTTDPNLTLAIFTADCGCLLLHDSQAGVIGAAHCGWKGTAADIMKNTIDKMVELGAHTENIAAGIGPCINECCFEVGAEVVPHFQTLLGADADKIYKLTNERSKKFHINLRKSVELRLMQLGIPTKNISHVDECTCCNPQKYFSYRVESGKTGRLAHIIHL